MSSMNRRKFIKQSVVVASALLTMPIEVFAQSVAKKVVIVGGGVAGATVARYLREFIPQVALVEITIIEPKRTYTTPFGTNEILTNMRTLEALTVEYTELEKYIGSKIVHQKALSIDNVNKHVLVADGTQYPYDYCIVATGIDFEYSDVVGLTSQNNAEVPHAYDVYNDGSTEQIEILKTQLSNMENGSHVVLVAPKNSYRCPPAPYERASQIAQFIKEHKPNSTLTIIDSKSSFAKQDSFEKAWSELYGYQTNNALIRWRAETFIDQIEISEAGKKYLITDEAERIEADVVSYIPTMKASKFTYDAGLVQSGMGAFDMAQRWCPINPETFESTMAGKQGIYVIGDSSRTSLPKSGYMANSQAKVCAIAIVSAIKGLTPLPESVVTNGCYSFVGKEYAISIFQKFKLNSDKSDYTLIPQNRGTLPLEADALWRKKEAEQGHAWYANFRRDCFGV